MLIKSPEELARGKPSEPRIIVIGSGAAGLYLASQLAASGLETVLIEAGNRHLGRFESNSYASNGRPHGGIATGRSRTLGGTTNLWGGQLVEFQPIDFDGRAWLSGSAWPVRYAEIAPYYATTYRNLGYPDQLQRDESIWDGLKTRRPDLGSSFEVFLTRWLKVPNFAAMYSREIERAERLRVLTGYTAVDFRGDGKKIDSVLVTDGRHEPSRIGGDTFVLAAGTIENSRLLLHTGKTQKWSWSENPNVGRYFHDHLAGRIGAFFPKDRRTLFDMFCNAIHAGGKFQPKFRMRNEALERREILNIQGLFAFESEVSEHLVYLKQFLRAALYERKITGGLDLLRLAGAVRFLLPLMWRYVVDHRVFIPSSAQAFLHVQAEQEPCFDSRISIDPSVSDQHGLPRAVLHWRLGGRELESIREFSLAARDALESSGLGRLELEKGLLEQNPDYLDGFTDPYHQAGGTIMGFSEADGVVDRNLLVFGTLNLYIAGASTFRTGSNANCTFTALAFTSRLADHLTNGALNETERPA